MNYRIIISLLLSFIYLNHALAYEEDKSAELEVRVENLERKILAKSSDSDQTIHSRIDTLEAAIKSINSKLEELSKKLNDYSSSIPTLHREANDNSSQISQNEDLIAQFAAETSTLNNQSKQPIKPIITGNITSEFEHAFTVLKNSEYKEAEKEFSSFVKRYPQHELTGQAYYWLGEVYYNKKTFNKAALNYLYSIKYFPDGIKAEQSTYKLASSFAKLGRKQEACSSFNNFLTKFKKAPPQLTESAKNEINKLGCSNVFSN